MNDTALLLGYQQRWMRDRARVRVWEKSRRIGASWTCACESVLAAAPVSGGSDTWYIAYSKEMTQEFMLDCTRWARALGVVAGEVEEEVIEDEDKDILTYRIRFASGCRITALSSRPTGLRGKQGRVIIDEAAFHDELGELIKSAVAVIMWGGRVDILSTHNGVDSKFNKIVEGVRAGRANYSLHRTTVDDALGEGLFQRICLVTGDEYSQRLQNRWRQNLIDYYGDDAKEELFCVPAQSGGTYLSRALVEGCMYSAPVYRYEAEPGFAALDDGTRGRTMRDWLRATLSDSLARLNPERWVAFGEDFGRTADLTVIPPVVINQNLSKTVPFIVELRDVPFREQEQALFYIVDHFPRFHHGALDDTGNGQYLAERAWQRYGENRIERVHLTEKWYGENLPKLKADFETKSMAIPRDADVLTDLQALKVIDGIPRLPKVRQRQKAGSRHQDARRHGDAAIGLALGHYASDMELREYAYESVEGPRARKGLD